MPGYANWETLFRDEYTQLFEEGYPVGAGPAPDTPNPYLPVRSGAGAATMAPSPTPADWEEAYWNLWRVREKGLRPDYPFREPDDYPSIIADASAPPPLQPLGDAEYAGRIKGAWSGRCAGVVLGKPLEVGMNHIEIRRYLESLDAYPLDDWVPIRSEKLDKALRVECLPSSRGHVAFVQQDDDIHYTILALLLAERKGTRFTKRDICMNWLGNLPYHWVWSCTKQAYYHLVNMTEMRSEEEQIDEFPTKLNPMREGINGAIRADMWGYLAPASPRKAAVLAHREASVNCVKNGIYGTMFVAACISAALSKSPSVDTILAGGYSVIPQQSRLAHALHSVERWYGETGDWIAVCDRIYANWGHLPFAGGINNLCFIVLALLHGGLDYTRAITTAVMCGTDTDCTGGTVGSIVGAARGIEGVAKRWVEPFHDTVKSAVGSFGNGTISELVERTIACRRRCREEVEAL